MAKEKIVKNVSELKQKARKLTADATRTVENVKQVVQTGLSSSKSVIEKASHVLNKKQISGGIEKASKGVDLVAKGARLASKGANNLASGLEKASASIRKAGQKLQD